MTPGRRRWMRHFGRHGGPLPHAGRVGARRGRHAALAALVLFATGAEPQGAADGQLSRQWLSVELAVVRHRAPDGQGEALVRFEPRRVPRRLALLEGSAPHPPVLAPLLPVQWGEAPEVEPLPPAWMWGDPPPLMAETETLAPDEAHETLAPAPEVVPETLAPIPDPPPETTPMAEARAAFQAFERGLVRGRGRWLGDELTLAGAVDGLRRSGDFIVLAHGRWLQTLPPNTRPMPLFAQFGERLAGGVFELEGTVSVSQGRYIDIALDLMAPEPPVAGDAWQLERDGYVLLAETRRSRVGEVHYFDHPRFGVVVKTQRVRPPEALLVLLRAAEEGL